MSQNKYAQVIFHRVNRKCDSCGISSKKRKLIGMFRKVNWFRGDDELVEVLCTDCCEEKYGTTSLGKINAKLN
jgi:hypothetical protein